MPHINRIRLVNVAFNDAKSIYDDFLMNFNGKSATYDLENGGGKSVLIMMLLQVVLPNTSLREDKPLKNIFSGGKDRTSHVLVEWLLDDGDRYKYLLTGFTARKLKNRDDQNSGDNLPAEDTDIQNIGVDYFNYYHLYNSPNDYDLKHLPLTQRLGGQRKIMGFEELKNLIRSLRQKNYPVEYFNKRGDYLNFLSMYNLIDTEWKIIQEINSGENNIENYFRENKTSRRLIENLLLKIIEDVDSVHKASSTFDNNQNKMLADTLIEIRQNLDRLLKDKQHLEEYKQIIDFYNKIKEIDERMRQDFVDLNAYRSLAVKLGNRLASEIERINIEIAEINNNLFEVKGKIAVCNTQKQLLEIQRVDLEKRSVENELAEREAARENIRSQAGTLQEKYRFFSAQNEFLNYKEEKLRFSKAEEGLQNQLKTDEGIFAEYQNTGYSYRLAVENVMAELARDLNQIESSLSEVKTEIEQTDGKIKDLKNQEGRLQGILSKLFEEKERLTKVAENLGHKLQEMDLARAILTPDEFVNNLEGELESLTSEIQTLAVDLSNARNMEQELSMQLNNLNGEEKLIEERLKSPKSFIADYQKEKDDLLRTATLYDAPNSLEELEDKIFQAITGIEGQILEKKIQLDNKSRKKLIFEKYQFYVPNEEVFALEEVLKKKVVYVKTGPEYLENLPEEAKKELIRKIPLIPYAVLVDNASFLKLRNGNIKIEGFAGDYPVPVLNVDLIRENQALDQGGIIFSLSETGLFVDKDKFNAYKNTLDTDIKKLTGVIEGLRETLANYRTDCDKLKSYHQRFSEEIVAEKLKAIKELENEKEKCRRLQRETREKIEINKTAILEYNKRLEELEKRKLSITESIGTLKEFIEDQKEISAKNKAISDFEVAAKKIQRQIVDLNSAVQTAKLGIGDLDNNKIQINISLKGYQDEFNNLNLAGFNNGEILEFPFDSLKSKFMALDERVKYKSIEITNLKETMAQCQKRTDDIAKRINREFSLTVEDFITREEQGEIFTAVSDDYILTLKKGIDDLNRQEREINLDIGKLGNKVSALGGKIEEKKNHLPEGVFYEYNQEYDDFGLIDQRIADLKRLLAQYEQDKINLENDERRLENQKDQFNRELDKFQEFMARENIAGNTNEIAAELLSYKDFFNIYDQLEKEIERKKEYWGKEIKNITAQTESFYIKEPLQDLKNLLPPSDLSECEEAIRQLNESIELTAEQMAKINHDINVLQGYHEEFIKQCVQKGDAILDSLKKFPPLSRIEINGIKRNMIEAHFYDYAPEEKMKRMETHINNIIKEIENEPSVQREKIAARLSSKELLAQVTDMDKATIRLYKVENIPEHSGYKRWEYAVGSEGQSNALYFIFAVCLISYIRILSINNTSFQSKKVIIADNPFGATSALYLWEPMFSILKENDVQLIAPGHNISKELISKFEVNYLLNQEIMEDDRLKVVVKDVRTEEDLEQMNFDVLQQISLFN